MKTKEVKCISFLNLSTKSKILIFNKKITWNSYNGVKNVST